MDANNALKVHGLRALQLLSYHHRDEVSKAALTIFLKADAQTALAATALLDRNTIASNPEAKARLDALLKPVIGKADFVALVERLNLTGFEKELLDFISANPNAPESVNAARLIAANRDGALRFLKDADAKSAKALIAALGRVSDRAAVAVMNQHFWPEKREDVRRVLIDALAGDALLLSDGVAELSVDSERIVDADTDADGDPECDEDSHDDADVVPPASDAEPVNDANDADAATVSLALMVGVAESPNAIEGVTVALSDTVTLCE
jgi:hypothetical protein